MRILTSLMTRPHCTTCASTNDLNAAGVLPAACNPCARNLALTSSACKMFLILSLSSLTIAVGAYRNFKLPFSRSATVSPSREAVNHAACVEDSPLSMRIRPLSEARGQSAIGRGARPAGARRGLEGACRGGALAHEVQRAALSGAVARSDSPSPRRRRRCPPRRNRGTSRRRRPPPRR